jgi:MFS family permease
MPPTLPKPAELQRTLVVVASMYLIMVANGGMLLLVVGLKQIAESFGWPRSVPSLAYAFLFIGTGFGGIVMGYWYDRSGAGPVTLLGTIMIGSGAMLSSLVQEDWHLYLIYGLMMGLLGQATIYGPLVLNVMSWFEHRRGFAIGLITAGQGLGGAIWPPVFRYFNETVGWRETFVWFGLFVVITSAPLTFLLRRPTTGAKLERVNESEMADLLPVSRPRVNLHLPAWLVQTSICLAIVGCCVSMSMPLAHLVAHASDLGHSMARAAEMLAVALLTATAVRLTAGTLLVDRFGGLASLSVFSALQAGALALFAIVDGLLAMYLVSVVFGLGYGGINMCYPLLVRDHLPPNESGRRLGVVLLFGALAMALGGWLAGYIFDFTGSYAPAFLVGVAFNVANLVLILTLFMRSRDDSLQPSTA